MGRELTPNRITPFTSRPCGLVVLCGISTSFNVLFPCLGQIAHALLTRPPLEQFGASSSLSPLDLHVLSTPPAFVLSQDQTLMFNPFQSFSPKNNRLFALSESDFFLFSLLCIVFKDRPPPLFRSPSGALSSSFRLSGSFVSLSRTRSLATTFVSIPNPRPFVNTFFQLF
jgi:hypothetical protein